MGCPTSGCVGYELLNDLNFDSDGDSDVDADDHGGKYWDNGRGWRPIAGTSGAFYGDRYDYRYWVPGGDQGHQSGYLGYFKGNGHTIKNLFIKRTSTVGFSVSKLGLFYSLGIGSRVESLGIINANVTGGSYLGILAGILFKGTIVACYTHGTVSGQDFAPVGTPTPHFTPWGVNSHSIGGLVGFSFQGTIHASYSMANVSEVRDVGGLVGTAWQNTHISSSYANGIVTGGNAFGRIIRSERDQGAVLPAVGVGVGGAEEYPSVEASWAGGLVGNANDESTCYTYSGATFACGGVRATTNIANFSYWDMHSSGKGTSALGVGKTTHELRSITGYTGIYSNWNIDIDGQGGNDDPWHFGTASQYPVLKYADMDTDLQFNLQPRLVTLILTPRQIDESGTANQTTVTAALTKPLTSAVVVTVSATAVAPAVAGDFTLSTAKTLTIAANATTSTGTVTITAVDNAIDAPWKRVTVAATVSGAMNIMTSHAILTIADDERTPTVTMAVNPSSISENGGVATVTATLSGSSVAPTSITVRSVPGAYTVGATDSTITIAAGQTANASDTVIITAVDNMIHAPDNRLAVAWVLR